MTIREDWLNTITCGDCFELLRQLPDESVDLVVTDPPYGIDFSRIAVSRVRSSRSLRMMYHSNGSPNGWTRFIVC